VSTSRAVNSGREAEAFRDRVRETFGFLKRTSTLDQLLAKALPLRNGWLLPICDLHADDERLIESLGRWRERHMEFHPTRFKVTDEGTRRWLSQAVIADPDRLLLLVADRHGHLLGHLGFTLSVDPALASLLASDRMIEYGYLVRGESGSPGLMSAALRAAIRWCHESTAPEEIYSLTFEDNVRALEFERAIGGVDRGVVPLRRHVEGDRIEYRPLEGPDGNATADAHFVVLSYPDRSDEDELGSIPLAGPSIGARETAYVLDAVRTGWNERRADYLERFASRFAASVDVRFALPTSSCTGAMHLALLALGIGPGDEVIVPDITWVATANAVALTGATPVIVEIEEQSWCMDPDSMRRAIGPNTRAVIPVHLYGYPARMSAIRELADEHGLYVLEDAAPAVGAAVSGRPIGSWGHMAAFSFQGAKLLVTGEGGMLVTDDEGLYQRARHLWDQARRGEHPFWCDEVAPKYRMSNLQAALGLGQLERLDALIEAKLRIHLWYHEELGSLHSLDLHCGEPQDTATHWMTSVLLRDHAPVSRDALARALSARGIDTRPTFPQLSTMPMWRSATAENPTAASVAQRGLNLPSGVCLRREQVARVAAEIREIVSGHGVSEHGQIRA
jgi:perosamine synthetase